MNIQITKRDKEILSFINEFGFCEMPQIQKQFNLKKPRNYQVIKRLIQGGLIKHQRVFHGRHGIYHLTTTGAYHTNLPAVGKVSLRHYEHHLTVIEVYMRLAKLHPDASWISERQLLIDKFAENIRKKGHLADGILHFPDGKKVAIEVELSRKGKIRIERILKKYGSEFSIKEVWYYCHPKIMAFLMTITEKMPFIKIFNIEDFLNETT